MKGDRIYLKAELIENQLYARLDMSGEEKRKLYSEYLKLLRKSAYLGNHKAQFHLGMTYEDTNYWGINPNYDPEKCVYWYQKACEGNISDACNSLGTFYEKGIGCEQNLELAKIMYQKAIRLGNKLAKNNYRIFRKQIKEGYFCQNHKE
jgi:TPR repeat protein